MRVRESPECSRLSSLAPEVGCKTKGKNHKAAERAVATQHVNQLLSEKIAAESEA